MSISKTVIQTVVVDIQKYEDKNLSLSSYSKRKIKKVDKKMKEEHKKRNKENDELVELLLSKNFLLSLRRGAKPVITNL